MRIEHGARKLGIAACCLFLASLALPAAEGTIFDSPTLLLGWEAAFFSVGMASAPISDPGIFVPALAAVSNIVFVIAPWMVLKKRTRAVSRAYALAVVVAFSLAATSPFALDNSPILHGGYFAWLLACLLLLGAATMRATGNLSLSNAA
jgi:hypothetical protein